MIAPGIQRSMRVLVTHEDVLKIQTIDTAVATRCIAVTHTAHSGSGPPSYFSPLNQSVMPSRIDRGSRATRNSGATRSIAYRIRVTLMSTAVPVLPAIITLSTVRRGAVSVEV